jgi:hypothetical protein
LATEEPDVVKLMLSAESRFSASSNEMRVQWKLQKEIGDGFSTQGGNLGNGTRETSLNDWAVFQNQGNLFALNNLPSRAGV